MDTNVTCALSISKLESLLKLDNELKNSGVLYLYRTSGLATPRKRTYNALGVRKEGAYVGMMTNNERKKSGAVKFEDYEANLSSSSIESVKIISQEQADFEMSRSCRCIQIFVCPSILLKTG